MRNWLSEFSFAHPWLLLLLLGIPVLAWLKGKFGGTAAVTFSTTSMLAEIGSLQGYAVRLFPAHPEEPRITAFGFDFFKSQLIAALS